MKRAVIFVLVCLAANAHAARFLFDAAHAETVGNADWIIDADTNNLTWNSTGTFTTSDGNNAGRLALMDEIKTMPFGAVWNYACAKANAPLDRTWMDDVKKYESTVLSRPR